MRILLVDNYDSFTWNVYDLIATTTGQPPVVVKNDVADKPDLTNFDAVVLSPGPGHPASPRDFGICADIARRSDIPVLGICLGHQGLCHINGGTVSHAPRPVHGEIHAVHHAGDSILAGIPSPFNVVRYHSLAVTEMPPNFRAIAHTADGVIMAIEATDRPHWGVQFHPESACSDYGAEIIRNFVALAERANAARRFRDNAVIHVRRVEAAVDPQLVFGGLQADARCALWLDSSAVSQDNRFSFIADPSGPHFETLAYDVNERTLTIRKGDVVTRMAQVDLLDHIKQRLAERAMPKPPELPFAFNLGYAGYLGYELKALTDGSIAHRSAHPDAQLFFVDRLLAYDHIDGVYWLLGLSLTEGEAPCVEAWLARTAALLTTIASEPPAPPRSALPNTQPVRFRHDKDAYVDRIRQSLEEIRNGESYEVCLTNMAVTTCDSPGLDVYHRLRSVSPVPFGAYLRFGGLEVLCGSPERFLSVSTSGEVESKPIKGTRPVDPDPVENARIVEELASNNKDRAENLMIVDLVRNDLSRCCRVGSVHVAKLFAVESYSLVHQLVSTIRGRLEGDKTVIDAIRQTFPGGSMTGAPKIRTMEIIDRLEDGPRGVYSGSIGYLALSGAADLNIVIRTIVLNEGVACFGVGGAVIALSDIEDEYEETLVKARSCLRALAAELAGARQLEQAK